MSKKSILIVEDEPAIAEVLYAYCKNAGFLVTHLDSGKHVVNHIKDNQIDLLLLDLMLPDVDGITICKSIRQFSQVPIIMVTARNEEIDRLIGLEIGADDYICKPFSPREVVARIKVILRRIPESTDNIIVKAGFELDGEKYQVALNNKPLDLTPIEFKLLECLLKNSNKVYSRQKIMDLVYSNFDEVNDRNVDTHIKNIRRKISFISPTFNPIVSVYGVGYKMEL